MSLKRFLIGRPLSTESEKHHRLSKVMALSVFSSDAMSSVAYATEEILIILMFAGAAAFGLSLPIAAAISALFAVVTLSYRQTIMAYPSGGGAYIVAKDNLGTFPGLAAAAALLTDYVLTVAVSISAGVAAITSAFPSLFPLRVEICLVCVGIILVMNLRGVKESGTVFMLPTYFFLASITILIVTGFFKVYVLHQAFSAARYQSVEVMGPVTLFLVLRAFSSGCTALTGIEAISNGIPAFRPPESNNARATITIMAVICVFMFGSITLLASRVHPVPSMTETVVSQIAAAIFGKTFFYFCLQAGTALILIMAANTSFADFPRLSAILARAGFMPRQMSNLGDRLVFANGIIMLGLVSSLLIIVFHGNTTRLIPLYSVGVFLSFTLSQSGMVVHWLKLREPGWRRSIVFNALGAVVTGVVCVVVAVTKFTHGAFIVIIIIPVLVFIFYRINAHYRHVAVALRVPVDDPRLDPLPVRVFLPISGITNVSLYALRFCFSISKDVTGLFVNTNKESAEGIEEQIKRLNLPIPIVTLDSPYRSITQPLIDFIDEESRTHPDEIITLVIPEFMPKRKWHYFLHNQTAMIIYAALRGRENVVITSVRKRLTR